MREDNISGSSKKIINNALNIYKECLLSNKPSQAFAVVFKASK